MYKHVGFYHHVLYISTEAQRFRGDTEGDAAAGTRSLAMIQMFTELRRRYHRRAALLEPLVESRNTTLNQEPLFILGSTRRKTFKRIFSAIEVWMMSSVHPWLFICPSKNDSFSLVSFHILPSHPAVALWPTESQ